MIPTSRRDDLTLGPGKSPLRTALRAIAIAAVTAACAALVVAIAAVVTS